MRLVMWWSAWLYWFWVWNFNVEMHAGYKVLNKHFGRSSPAKPALIVPEPCVAEWEEWWQRYTKYSHCQSPQADLQSLHLTFQGDAEDYTGTVMKWWGCKPVVVDVANTHNCPVKVNASRQNTFSIVLLIRPCVNCAAMRSAQSRCASCRAWVTQTMVGRMILGPMLPNKQWSLISIGRPH